MTLSPAACTGLSLFMYPGSREGWHHHTHPPRTRVENPPPFE